MKHAKNSASAAIRWLNCAGSSREVAKLPAAASSFEAAQGTYAHFVAAHCLDRGYPGIDARPFLGSVGIVDGHNVVCDQEMVDGVNFYLDDCDDDAQPGDATWVEVDLTPKLAGLHPDLGGNADRVRWRASTGELRVTDFKYGAGIMVGAEDNKQLMVYALGAMMAMNLPGVKTIEARIVQPRIEHPDGRARSWTFDAAAIVAFAGECVAACERARAPDAPLTPGWWCRKSFCPAARTCPALEKYAHSMLTSDDFAATAQLPAVRNAGGALVPYDMDKLVTALGMIEPLEAKIKALRDFAYGEAARGVAVPGWKLVAKRPTRRVADESGAIAWAKERGIDPYEAPSLKSPAQLEKGTKKTDKEALAEFVKSESSGNTLVRASDDRPEVKLLTDDSFAAVDGTAATNLKLESKPPVNLFAKE